MEDSFLRVNHEYLLITHHALVSQIGDWDLESVYMGGGP